MEALGVGAWEPFFSCDLGVMKPDARYFAAVGERLGVQPEAIAFLDDSESHVIAAQAAGWTAFHYRERDDLDAISAALIGGR